MPRKQEAHTSSEPDQGDFDQQRVWAGGDSPTFGAVLQRCGGVRYEDAKSTAAHQNVGSPLPSLPLFLVDPPQNAREAVWLGIYYIETVDCSTLPVRKSRPLSGMDMLLVGDKINFKLPPNVRHVHYTWMEMVRMTEKKLFGGRQLPGLRMSKPYKCIDLKPMFEPGACSTICVCFSGARRVCVRLNLTTGSTPLCSHIQCQYNCFSCCNCISAQAGQHL